MGSISFAEIMGGLGMGGSIAMDVSRKQVESISDPMERKYAIEAWERERYGDLSRSLNDPRAQRAMALQADLQNSLRPDLMSIAAQHQAQQAAGLFGLPDYNPFAAGWGQTHGAVTARPAISPKVEIPWCGKPFLLPKRGSWWRLVLKWMTMP